jgi:hypothetical protein
MAGLGRKTFTAGEVLTAANVQGYLQDQVVQVYASSAARSSAIGTAVSEGMMSYLSDTNSVEYYSGSAWVAVSATSSGTTVSAAYTATATDVGNTIVANGTASYTITIPDILSTWQRIDIIRDSSGTVSIAAGTGVTTWAGAGTAGTAVTFKISSQYGGASVEKVAANSYRVIGGITA